MWQIQGGKHRKILGLDLNYSQKGWAFVYRPSRLTPCLPARSVGVGRRLTIHGKKGEEDEISEKQKQVRLKENTLLQLSLIQFW